MLQRIVDWQEAHLRAHRLGTCGRINTLENPKQLIMDNINTSGHIHPYTQRVGHIQALAIRRHIGRHGEDEIAETEIRQTERSYLLVFRHIVCNSHSGCWCHSEIRVILEFNGVIHFICFIDKTNFFVIASGTFDLVGVLRAFLLFGITIQFVPPVVSFVIMNDTSNTKVALARSDSFESDITILLPTTRESVWRCTTRCVGDKSHFRDFITIALY